MYHKSSVKLPGQGGRGSRGGVGDYYFISNIFEGGALIEMGGLFNLAKKMVSILHKELACIVEKLKYKKLEVMQMGLKNKSELPAGE